MTSRRKLPRRKGAMKSKLMRIKSQAKYGIKVFIIHRPDKTHVESSTVYSMREVYDALSKYTNVSSDYFAMIRNHTNDITVSIRPRPPPSEEVSFIDTSFADTSIDGESENSSVSAPASPSTDQPNDSPPPTFIQKLDEIINSADDGIHVKIFHTETMTLCAKTTVHSIEDAMKTFADIACGTNDYYAVLKNFHKTTGIKLRHSSSNNNNHHPQLPNVSIAEIDTAHDASTFQDDEVSIIHESLGNSQNEIGAPCATSTPCVPETTVCPPEHSTVHSESPTSNSPVDNAVFKIPAPFPSSVSNSVADIAQTPSLPRNFFRPASFTTKTLSIMSGEREPFELSQPSKKNMKSSSIFHRPPDPQEGPSTSLSTKTAISNPILHRNEVAANSAILKSKITVGKLIPPPKSSVNKIAMKAKNKRKYTDRRNRIALNRRDRIMISQPYDPCLSMPIIDTDVPIETSQDLNSFEEADMIIEVKDTLRELCNKVAQDIDGPRDTNCTSPNLSESGSVYSLVDRTPAVSPSQASPSQRDGVMNLNNSPRPHALRSPTPHPVAHGNTSCPTDHQRTGDVLKLIYPLNGMLWCPENRCSYSTGQLEWSAKAGALRSHYKTNHRLKLRLEKWCRECKQLIRRRDTKNHECFNGIPMYPTEEVLASFKYRCDMCNIFGCNSTKGLINHMEAHRRADAREEAAAIRANNNPTARSPSPLDSHQSGNINVSAESNDSTGISDASQILEVIDDTAVDDEEDTEQPAPFENIIPNPDEKAPSDPFINPFKQILTDYAEDRWADFEHLVNEFITAAQKKVKVYGPPPARPATTSNQYTQDQVDPSFIQRLYRKNRRRAVRKVLGHSQNSCKISHERLKEKFFPTSTPPVDLSVYSSTKAAASPPISSRFSNAEVLKKLNEAENTSPGPDKLTFNHLKSFDPEAKVLTLIFNICFKAQKIPQVWKISRTIFIPKSGELTSPDNWRPISLSSSIYKLYVGLITRRVSSWLERHSILSPAQKGFRPFDGTIENNFALEHRINEAKRLKQQICILLIDIKNAFGCLPHEVIIEAFRSAGVGEKYLAIIKDLYSNNFTQLLTEDGLSELIPILCGIKQGCPFSGNAFNISVNPMYPAVIRERAGCYLLGYADDTCSIEDNPDDLQLALDIITEFAEKIGLRLNPNKCKTLHITPNSRPRCRPTTLYVRNVPVEFLRDHEVTKYLGKPLGFNILENQEELTSLISTAESIMRSNLAPWQRLDALKSFFFPSLNYLMRTEQHSKKSWRKLDDCIRKMIKEVLYVPERASYSYIHGDPEDGLLGIPLAGLDADIAKIDTAFKLLTSSDQFVKSNAWAGLSRATQDRTISPPTLIDMAHYLSSREMGGTNRYSSLWSRARAASGRAGVKWQITPDRKITIIYDSEPITDRRKIFKSIRKIFRKSHTTRLSTLKSQGKTLECFASAKASSHFMKTGDYLRFTDWRFIHSARLNLMRPYLNAYNPEIDDDDLEAKQCRRCDYHLETLPHVLNSCKRHLREEITERHDRVVQRLIRAATSNGRWVVLTENQEYGASTSRPDLILINNSTSEALVLDVAMPFEDGLEKFNNRRQEKINKYIHIHNDLKLKYRKVSTDAIIVGPLGSWDRKNDKTILKLCSKKYAHLMRNLIVSDTIRASRDIFWKHIQGVKQYDNRSRYAVIREVFTPPQMETPSNSSPSEQGTDTLTSANPTSVTPIPSNQQSQNVDSNHGAPLPNTSDVNAISLPRKTDNGLGVPFPGTSSNKSLRKTDYGLGVPFPYNSPNFSSNGPPARTASLTNLHVANTNAHSLQRSRSLNSVAETLSVNIQYATTNFDINLCTSPTGPVQISHEPSNSNNLQNLIS